MDGRKTIEIDPGDIDHFIGMRHRSSPVSVHGLIPEKWRHRDVPWLLIRAVPWLFNNPWESGEQQRTSEVAAVEYEQQNVYTCSTCGYTFTGSPLAVSLKFAEHVKLPGHNDEAMLLPKMFPPK